VGRIMLEFTLLAWDSENYNIIKWGSDGDIDRVLRACWRPSQRLEIGLSCLIGWL
jgi:hypothetical protein